MEKQEFIKQKALTIERSGSRMSRGECENFVKGIIEENASNEEDAIRVLKEVSPLLDELVLRTPTGDLRNKICDVNIQVQQCLYGTEKI